MNTREVAVVAVVVLVGVAGAALPTVAATTADPAAQVEEPNETATEANATDRGSGDEPAAFGTQMTAFMQSSASEANDTVESGMWTAGFERANESKQARMAERRAGSLEQRLERLRERNQTLTERYENGSLSRSAYVAQSSQLSGRIAALRTSVDETDRAAERAGINDTRFDTLRTEARNMTGPETAGVARDVVAGGQGPPADRGLPGERGNGPDVVPGSGNGTDAGNLTGNVSLGNGDLNVTNASGSSTGGGNANPSDRGVGTGSDGTGSGDASNSGNSSSDGAGADGDSDDVNGSGTSGDVPGNGNAGSGTGDAADPGSGDDGDDSSGDGDGNGNGDRNGNDNGGTGNEAGGNGTGNGLVGDLLGL
ncbi:hypothetical protein OB920_14010 [Halobacteria archaeon HArc-gm2]|nr:hypothetical protein [Halobacteria archaeon HArc-gm2]